MKIMWHLLFGFLLPPSQYRHLQDIEDFGPDDELELYYPRKEKNVYFTLLRYYTKKRLAIPAGQRWVFSSTKQSENPGYLVSFQKLC